MRAFIRRFLPLVILCSAIPLLSDKTLGAQAADDPVLASLQQELHRSFDNLKKQPVPAYFLAYQLTDNHSIQVSASFGALTSTSDQHTACSTLTSASAITPSTTPIPTMLRR